MKSVFSLYLKTCRCLGQTVDVKIKSHLILTNFPILWDLWDEFSLLPLQPKFSRDQSCYTYTHYLTWNPDWWPYPSSLNKWVSFPDPVAAKNTFQFLMKWHLIFYDQIQLIKINSTIFTSELPVFNDEPHFVCCSSAHHFPMIQIISQTKFPGFPHDFPMISLCFPYIFPTFSIAPWPPFPSSRGLRWRISTARCAEPRRPAPGGPALCRRGPWFLNQITTGLSTSVNH